MYSYAAKPIFDVDRNVVDYEKIYMVSSSSPVPRGYVKLFSDIETRYPRAVESNKVWSVVEDVAAKAQAEAAATALQNAKDRIEALTPGDLATDAQRTNVLMDLIEVIKSE